MTRRKTKFVILVCMGLACVGLFVSRKVAFKSVGQKLLEWSDVSVNYGSWDRTIQTVFLGTEGPPSPPISTSVSGKHLDHRSINSGNNSSTNRQEQYLKLINSFHANVSSGSVPDSIKDQVENLIRSGDGLRPYTTDGGEAAWMENGIVYRPRGASEISHDHYPMDYKAFIPFNESVFFEGKEPPDTYKSKRKVILWYRKTRYAAEKTGLSPISFCPDFPCHITTNRKYAAQSSAMIFTAQILEKSPPPRKPDQVFILHNHEAPLRHSSYLWVDGFNRPSWKSVFNWTMTYRMDSDFAVPYAVVRKRLTPPADKDYRKIVSRKKKLVAWLVSHCTTSSQRERYVKELQKFISVDILGKCGVNKCPYKKEKECSDKMEATYKFYLSFENAICSDYITEKFFRYLTMDVVVVARGSNDYFRHAPREIFLNTADFQGTRRQNTIFRQE